jgi:hypothetical protein
MFAPGQVVEFFIGGLLHAVANLYPFCGERLTLIETLGTDFAGVVDTHQASNVLRLGSAK